MSEANERRNMTGSRRWAQLTGQDPDFAVPISEPDLIHEQFIYDWNKKTIQRMVIKKIKYTTI